MSKITVDDIINDLLSKGSDISYLKNLREESLRLTKKDIDLKEMISIIENNLRNETVEFLTKKNNDDVNYISGISSSIYLPDYYNNGEINITLIGGTRNRNSDVKVDEFTKFDIASITKLYLLVLLFKLEEIDILNLDDKIVDHNPDFKGLEDFTFNDLIRLHGEIRTNGNITKASSCEEAYDILKTAYLESNSREENKYNDFGAIILGDTIEKVILKTLGKQMTLDEIMNMIIFKPLKINDTVYNPLLNNLSGNGNELGLVHDPKARCLGGVTGSAGIFTTSDGLSRLAKAILSANYVDYKFLTEEHLKRFGEITFPNSKQSNKGNLGVYVKHPLGYDKTFTPPEFSTGSFSHQGWTGALATFDPNNLIHQNILVNAIYNNDDKLKVRNDKPIGYGNEFDNYLQSLTHNTMLIYIAKKYCNIYKEDKTNINKTLLLK